jgi:hypothetical protein
MRSDESIGERKNSKTRGKKHPNKKIPMVLGEKRLPWYKQHRDLADR